MVCFCGLPDCTRASHFPLPDCQSFRCGIPSKLANRVLTAGRRNSQLRSRTRPKEQAELCRAYFLLVGIQIRYSFRIFRDTSEQYMYISLYKSETILKSPRNHFQELGSDGTILARDQFIGERPEVFSKTQRNTEKILDA